MSASLIVIHRSIVVDYLKHNFDTEGMATTCVFFSYKEQEAQSPVNVLSSILQQILQANMYLCSHEMGALQDRHQRNRTRPTLKEVTTLLQSVVQVLEKTFIVIDALDECPESSGTRDVFLQELRLLAPYVHILVTCRPVAITDHILGSVSTIEILANDEDIRAYCKGRMQTDRRLTLYVKGDPVLQEEIIATIIQHCKGMYVSRAKYFSFLRIKHVHIDSLKVSLGSASSRLFGATIQ